MRIQCVYSIQISPNANYVEIRMSYSEYSDSVPYIVDVEVNLTPILYLTSGSSSRFKYKMLILQPTKCIQQTIRKATPINKSWQLQATQNYLYILLPIFCSAPSKRQASGLKCLLYIFVVVFYGLKYSSLLPGFDSCC